MFQRQTSISYSTKTDLALNEEIISTVQHIDRQKSVFKSKNDFGGC